MYNLQIFIVLSFIIIYHFRTTSIILLQGLLTILFPQVLNPYFSPEQSHNALFAISNSCAHSFTYCILMTLALKMKHTYSGRLFYFFAHISVFNSLYIIYKHIVQTPGDIYGLGLASSFDSVLIAIMYPIVIKYSINKHTFIKYLYLSAPVIAILLCRGSNGVGCLLLSILLLNKSKKFLIFPLLIFICALILSTSHSSHHPFLHDSGRFNHYLIIANFWFMHTSTVTHLFGTGLGTYSIIGPYAQIMHQQVTHITVTEWFLILHSDWLQILFEFGIIGLILSITTLVYLIIRAAYRPYLISTLITYSGAMMFYYPLHNPITALFGVLLISNILRSKKECIDNDK